MGVEQMYYNRQKDPSRQPQWIAIRGSSKLEGYHPHLHACLPGTNYSPALAHAIITLFNFAWNYKRSVQNGGAIDHHFHDLWMLERMKQLCDEMHWDSYRLPYWKSAPDSSEKFGLDYIPEHTAVVLAQQQVIQHTGAASQLLSEADEDLLDDNSAAAGLPGEHEL